MLFKTAISIKLKLLLHRFSTIFRTTGGTVKIAFNSKIILRP